MLAVAAIWWLRPHAAVVDERMQVGVLGAGFTTLSSGRIVELDREGEIRARKSLGVEGDVRLVGTRLGTAVGWLEGRQLTLATLDAAGRPDRIEHWGTNVVALCDGVATNQDRFAIGWLDASGGVHAVDGWLATMSVVTAPSTWCGIASAGRRIVLLSREGSGLYMNFCGDRACDGRFLRVPFDRSDELLGYGCLRDSCLFALRDGTGRTWLRHVTEQGRLRAWLISDASPLTAFAIVAVGVRAFAIAYAGGDGASTVQRLELDGTRTELATFGGAVPALAWSAGKLLVARPPASFSVLDVPAT